MNFLGYNNCLPNMEHSHLKLKRKESNLHGEPDKGSWTLCLFLDPLKHN